MASTPIQGDFISRILFLKNSLKFILDLFVFSSSLTFSFFIEFLEHIEHFYNTCFNGFVC